jgi:hypothetical protein
VDAHRVHDARTDINAHFVIDSVPPGKYLLFASDYTSEGTKRWLTPVIVAAGDTARVDLSDVATGDVVCYTPVVVGLRRRL